MTCQRPGIGLICIALCGVLLATARAAPTAQPVAIATSRSAQRPAGGSSSGPATSAAHTGSAGVAQSTAPPSGPPALPPLPLSADKVLAYVKQTLDWYRETQGLEQVPQLSSDVVDRDRLRGVALTVLRLAFDFGRAAAGQLAAGATASGARGAGASASSAGASSASSPQRSLDQASARIASRIAGLESQLAALDARLARAPARSRTALRAQRGQLAAALSLEREVQTTVQELQRFQSSMLTLQGAGAKDLLGQIADLERSVPEVRQGAAAERGMAGTPSGAAQGGSAASSASGGGTARPPGGQGVGPSGSAGAAAPAAATFHPESAGIIALMGEWISLQSADGQLDDMLKSTDALSKQLDALRAPLIAQARALARGDTSGIDSTDPAELEASRRALEAAAARFRQLSAVLVPLGDQDFVLDSADAALTQWVGAMRAQIGGVARYLLMRVVILATLVVTVLIVSEVWRRAVFKYLHDSRRRSQFQTLRRVIIGVALAVVILFALVSQMGSLATYVGFLTAGLAVALQNVILSIVGYFFLIGRYGVRVGDRITLAGVTGRVVDIGLIRIYLMELAGSDLHSTGRIVVLSNSVLFQPQALFKQIPGADYMWHTISLTLAPNVDVQAAQQHLKSTADEVFEHYRPSIEAQHAAVRRLVDFDTVAPSPEVRVRFAERGWQFDVRYPVHAEQAARIDQRMLKAVRAAIAGEEHFPLAEAGDPALKAAEA